MTRREALAKATITTADASAGLLDPEQSAAFIRATREGSTFGSAIRLVTRGVDSGEIDKISTGRRIIRKATENSDDGYRAGAAFGTVPYQTTKVRLPWEVTEDVFHSNIEREGLEATLTAEMTAQFGEDWDDLDINGNTAATGIDAPFLTIDDGIIRQVAAANIPGRNIDASTIAGGEISKSHYFEALYAMPNKYRKKGGLRWLMSPNRAMTWWESLTDRNTAAGDDVLSGNSSGAGGAAARGPAGIPIQGSQADGLFTPGIPQWPDSVIMLADPRNFVRVVSWDVRKRKVTGETDMELAARDKRFYIFFVKRDIIVEEMDAVVSLNGFDPIG